MEIRDFKKKLLEGDKFEDTKLVFTYSTLNDLFIIEEYINRLAKNRNQELCKVEWSEERKDIAYKEDKLNYCINSIISEDMIKSKIEIFIGTKIGCNTCYDFEQVDVTIDENQILMWAISKTNLQENKVKWICESCDYSVYKINNELKKLDCDNPEDRFNQLNLCNNYVDLGEFDFNDLIKSILKKDEIDVKVQMQDDLSFLTWEDINRFIEELHNEYIKILLINKTRPNKEDINKNGLTLKEFKYYRDVICDLYEEIEIANILLKLNELKVSMLKNNKRLFKNTKDCLQYIIFMIK